MTQAKENDKVKVHYTGKLGNGQVFDQTKEEEPFEFQIGEGKIIPGFENAIIGMEENEEKEVTVGPDQAFGEVSDDMIQEVPRENIEKDVSPEVGQEVNIKLSDETLIPARIVEVKDETITIDANHPLAGHELTFNLKLVEVG